MKHILLVCTGNTCRSVMAEALLDDEIGRSSRLEEKIKTDSAGTFACVDAEATPNAIAAMEEMGLSVEKHKAKQVDQELIDWADLILVMEASHYEQMEAMFPETESKMHTIKGYAEGEDGFPGFDGFNVDDPYEGDLEVYRECAAQLKELVQKIVRRWEREL